MKLSYFSWASKRRKQTRISKHKNRTMAIPRLEDVLNIELLAAKRGHSQDIVEREYYSK